MGVEAHVHAVPERTGAQTSLTTDVTSPAVTVDTRILEGTSRDGPTPGYE